MHNKITWDLSKALSTSNPVKDWRQVSQKYQKIPPNNPSNPTEYVNQSAQQYTGTRIRNLRNDDNVAVERQILEGLMCPRNWWNSPIEMFRLKEGMNAIIDCIP